MLLEHTLFKDTLLACCDPLAWVPWPSHLAPNLFLLMHFYYYERAAFTTIRDCGSEAVAHVNLAICQVVWFGLEYFTFAHTLQWEQRTLYLPDGRHPCPERPYYSTWIPIWQDFVYNTAGQLVGLLLWRRRHSRFSRLFQAASLIRWPWRFGEEASTDCC